MEKRIRQVASLIGNPTRALVLYALLDGRAYTDSELSDLAGSSPQNTSMHLAKLIRADLLTVEKQGRHRYYRFSREEVAYAMEAIANLVPAGTQQRTRPASGNGDIRYLRIYDPAMIILPAGSALRSPTASSASNVSCRKITEIIT